MTQFDLYDRIFFTPRRRAVTLFLREDTSDHNIAQSCLTEDQYGFRDRYLEGTALDVGAHIGTVALGLAMDNPGLCVVAVEPLPENRRLADRNLRLNGVRARVRLVAGMAGRTGNGVISYAFDGNEHNAYVGGHDTLYEGSPHRTLAVRSYGLDELVTPDLSMLKIDCEGGEWVFLDSPAVDRVPLIIGEWHRSRGGSRARLRGLLDATHDITFSGPEAGPGGFVATHH